MISTGRTFDSLDPALGYDGPAWNLLSMLYDGLTAFQRVGNPDGTKLVPDLATSLPSRATTAGPTSSSCARISATRTDSSSGQRDFRYGLERFFALHP